MLKRTYLCISTIFIIIRAQNAQKSVRNLKGYLAIGYKSADPVGVARRVICALPPPVVLPVGLRKPHLAPPPPRGASKNTLDQLGSPPIKKVDFFVGDPTLPTVG